MQYKYPEGCKEYKSEQEYYCSLPVTKFQVGNDTCIGRIMLQIMIGKYTAKVINTQLRWVVMAMWDVLPGAVPLQSAAVQLWIVQKRGASLE